MHTVSCWKLFHWDGHLVFGVLRGLPGRDLLVRRGNCVLWELFKVCSRRLFHWDWSLVRGVLCQLWCWDIL